MAEDYNRFDQENDDTLDLYEETAAEIAPPLDYERVERRDDVEAGGRGFGYIALLLAILSLFTSPILFGLAGLILGFIARARGATGLGNWAIGISAVSVIITLFLSPFF